MVVVAAEPPITDADLAALVATMDEAAAAYIDGEIEHYLSLFDHGDDYTLMPPYGGPTVRGFERTDEGLAATKAFFASGEGRFDCQQTYASGDLAVLVGVERQHGPGRRVPRPGLVTPRDAGVPPRRRSLGAGWHRHADALVDEIPFDRFADLARSF